MRYAPWASITRPALGLSLVLRATLVIRLPSTTTVVSDWIVPPIVSMTLAWVMARVCARAASANSGREKRSFCSVCTDLIVKGGTMTGPGSVTGFLRKQRYYWAVHQTLFAKSLMVSSGRGFVPTSRHSDWNLAAGTLEMAGAMGVFPLLSRPTTPHHRDSSSKKRQEVNLHGARDPGDNLLRCGRWTCRYDAQIPSRPQRRSGNRIGENMETSFAILDAKDGGYVTGVVATGERFRSAQTLW